MGVSIACSVVTAPAVMIALLVLPTPAMGAGPMRVYPRATTARQAVQINLNPYYRPGYNFATCSTVHPRTAQHPPVCPITARLRHQLARFRQTHSRFDIGLPFCRCQSGVRTVRIESVRSTGHVAHVTVWWDMGASSFTATFVVVRQGAGWFVDDEYCAGRPQTSLYRGEQPCR